MSKKKVIKVLLLITLVDFFILLLIGAYAFLDNLGLKGKVINYLKYYGDIWLLMTVIAIIAMFFLSIKLRKNEIKVDIIFWIILILSLFIIFSNFISQKAYYMYQDVGSDTINQYYPYLVNEVKNIKDGRFFTWNFDYGLGVNILSMNAWTFDVFSITLVILRTNSRRWKNSFVIGLDANFQVNSFIRSYEKILIVFY